MKPEKAVLVAVACSWLLAAVTVGSFCLYFFLPRHVVPILTYHRFGNESSSLNVTADNFERQMAFLSKNRYKVITLDDLVEGIKGNRPLARKSVVITIDDGYRDSFDVAYPILKKYKFPATIFLAASSLDEDKAFLEWREARLMLNDGISLGSHTLHHVYVPDIKKEDDLWKEIRGSKDLVESRIGQAINYFCYPTGGFTDKAKELVKKAGFKAACATNRGNDALNHDLYELKRIKITNKDGEKLFYFRMKLCGYYNLFRHSKKSS